MLKARSSNKKVSYKKIPYKEVCETSPGVDNKKIWVKISRLLIRYITRIIGYKKSINILNFISNLLALSNNNSKNLHYIKYLFEINKSRLEYLYSLSKNELVEAVYKKNIWAETVLEKSYSLRSRLNAKAYLSLLSEYGFFKSEIDRLNCEFRKETNKKFYIYGPNAKSEPSLKYKDYTLVLMKPMKSDSLTFQEKLLFINSSYYVDVVSKDSNIKRELIDNHDKVYVSCRESVLDNNFYRAKFPLVDNISGAMGLGRVLYNLMHTYGKFSCVVEGFDFYLDGVPYGDYYPSLTRQKDNSLSEQVICSGLAYHDALYNFLYVKSIINHLEVIDSYDFKKVIANTGKEYFSALSKARNFRTLGNI